ncbi:MAG: choice-of-anchor Q domain-containing protein [Bacteroidota bacterium]
MKFFLTYFLLLAGQSTLATNYYVQASGSDNNNGLDPTTPFKNIQTAADLTNPGDTVFVMNGTYSNEFTWQDVVKISRSGTADNWIVYTSYANYQPKIEFDGWHGFKIEGSSGSGVRYIKIMGFEIEGNNDNVSLSAALNQPGGCNDPSGNPDGFYNGNGIASDGRFEGQNHHITISNCKIHNCGGNGVSAIHTDYVTIENCEIFNNAWYSIYGTSGISFYQLWNSNSTTVVRNIIRGNRIYGNRMFVPWIDAPCAITDGNGIIIDDSKNTQNGSNLGRYTGKTLIENNLVYENGGRGIHVFESDSVVVLNNTTYNNGQSDEISDGEITVIFSDNVKVVNNILYAKMGEKLNTVAGSSEVRYDFNLNFNANTYDVLGANSLLGQNPQFTDLNNYDFTLAANSPAIDAGSSSVDCFAAMDFLGRNRPVGSGVDMGAYEYEANTDNCDGMDLAINDQPISNGTYRASRSITSEGIVAASSTVRFFAGEVIDLLPNFVAEGNFTAAINTCSSNDNFEKAVEALPTSERQSTDLVLFPNPVGGHMATLQFNLDKPTTLRCELFDMTGKMLRTIARQQNYDTGSHQITFDVRALEAGIYLLYFMDAGKVSIFKLVKQ